LVFRHTQASGNNKQRTDRFGNVSVTYEEGDETGAARALAAYVFPTHFSASAAQQSIWDNWLPTIEALQLSAASLWDYLW
jgi:hypothetical protein